MAQTYIPVAPVTAPVTQMTVPQAAPMPTIQQVQNPSPVAFPQQTWHDKPSQPWPYHNPQAQQNVPPVNIQPAAPVPARPPPMVIPMRLGGNLFQRSHFLTKEEGTMAETTMQMPTLCLWREFGLTRRGGRPTYRKPYPEFIDEVEFPRNFRISEFATFNGEGEQSTLEHISRFTVQCGKAAANPWLKVRLFPNTLTGYAFRWYSNLPANSIQSWQQFEDLFHTQFYRAELEVSMADLSRLYQLPGDKVAKYEELLREEQDRKNSSKGTYYRDLNYEVYTTETEGEFEVNVAELNIKKAYTCEALTKPKSATANL
ncbi:uncharacterized protein LOC132313923 [Cornus florida]|uniref:uncharacterized protein LOC132313923 n=1 Tax=Cornus florida TaxID=4283 RepID=UPI00289DFC3D|nr:uncharacterized protein LOC132313923 [Cornus florida]